MDTPHEQQDSGFFTIGDTIWTVYAGKLETTRPCRICAGKKRVTLILGSEEQVELDCGYCGHGFEGPRGIETEYDYGAKATSYVVSAVEQVRTAEGSTVHYRSGTNHAYVTLEHERCFATEAEALAHGEVLVARAKADAEERMSWKEQSDKKSYAWNAGYHLKRAKDAARELEYHSRKAVLLKAKAKTEVKDA